jgi:hypothetical protein
MYLDAHTLMHEGLVILSPKFLKYFGKVQNSEVVLRVPSTCDKLFFFDEYVENPLLRRVVSDGHKEKLKVPYLTDFLRVFVLEGIPCQIFVRLAEGCIEMAQCDLIRALFDSTTRSSDVEAKEVFDHCKGRFRTV